MHHLLPKTLNERGRRWIANNIDMIIDMAVEIDNIDLSDVELSDIIEWFNNQPAPNQQLLIEIVGGI